MTPEIEAAAPGPAAETPEVLSSLAANLPEEDGIPLESDWHRMAISLLIEIVRFFYRERRDFFAGGNMFLYYSAEQARSRDYRGPDFFFVWNVRRDKLRRYWATWEEAGKYPNVIIELLSPRTAQEDRTTKKQIYEQTFRTPEYFLYDPDSHQLEGWRLNEGDHYEPLAPEEGGRIWSKQLELYLGTWEGVYLETSTTWLRFYDVHGKLILTAAEAEKQLAASEKQRADAEQQRADAALAENERLRQELETLRQRLSQQGAP
jgi:Uma2 family endonuclease